MDQAGEFKLSLYFMVFQNVQGNRVLSFVEKDFRERDIEIEEGEPDGLGHSSKIMVDEGGWILNGFILHFCCGQIKN